MRDEKHIPLRTGTRLEAQTCRVVMGKGSPMDLARAMSCKELRCVVQSEMDSQCYIHSASVM